MPCGRSQFDPWVGKIPWRRESLSPLVFWPGEFHGLCISWGRKELGTTERLSLSFSLSSGHRTSPLSRKFPHALFQSALFPYSPGVTTWVFSHRLVLPILEAHINGKNTLFDLRFLPLGKLSRLIHVEWMMLRVSLVHSLYYRGAVTVWLYHIPLHWYLACFQHLTTWDNHGVTLAFCRRGEWCLGCLCDLLRETQLWGAAPRSELSQMCLMPGPQKVIIISMLWYPLWLSLAWVA